MSNTLDLRMRFTADNRGVAGTVRDTRRQVSGLTSEFSGASSAARTSAGSMATVTTAGQEATRMFRVQKGALQQAGFQFQDLAVQIGSGTSAFVAIGQQGSQLLGILGPGGALLGALVAIGSVVGGTLYSSLMTAGGGVDALADSMEYLDGVMSRTETGAFELTDRIRDLARESSLAAEIEIQRGLVESTAAFNAAKASLLDVAEDRLDTTITGDFEAAISQAARLARAGKDVNEMFEEFGNSRGAMFREGLSNIRAESENLSSEFGITAESARLLIGALGSMQADPTTESLRQLQQALFDANNSAENVTPEFTRLTSELAQLAQQGVDAAEKGKVLEQWARDLGNALETTSPEVAQARDELEGLLEKLRVQGETIGLTSLQMIEYNRQSDLKLARDRDANATQIATIELAYDRIYAHEQEVIAAKKEAEAQKELAQSQKEMQRAQEEYRQSVQQLVNELDPLGAQFESVYEKQQLLIQAAADGKISEAYRDTLITNLVDGLADAGDEGGTELAERMEKQMSRAGDRVAGALQDSITSGDWDGVGATIGGALAGAIGGMVTDTLMEQMAGQAGASIFGPLAGAIAGGVAGLAVTALSDYLSSDDWDPTEDRQARQGTGTVLGDINAKSESIRRAVENSEDGIGQLVGINQGMLRALQTLQLGISGAVTMVARERRGIDFATENRYSQAQLAGGGLGIGIGGVTTGSFGPAFGFGADVYSFIDDALGGILSDGLEFLDNLTGGLLSSIGSSVFGGDQKVVDEGIRIIGGNINDLVNRTLVQAYATIKEDGGWFSSDKRFDRFQDIATNQFSLAFASIYDSIEASADALGIDAGARLAGFTVDTQRISLEDLSADEQQAELEAYFSTVFDDLAGTAVPFLEEFQRAGEGLGETLARVANQTLVTQEAVTRLGVRFSDLAGRELVKASERLVEAAGGIEQFIGSMESFIDNFATDAQQFALAQSDITRALSQANLQLPATREGYYELLQAQNGATESGAENIATLLRLQGVADEYYTYLEDAQISLLNTQRNAINETLQAAERASNSVSRALEGLVVTGGRFDQLSRERALASLDQMAATGDIGSQSALDQALSSASNINLAEFATFNDYIRTVARTGATLTNLQQVTDRQVTREQRLLENIERQLQGMNNELAAVGRQSVKNTAKTAKILERIELDGLEVRE